MKRECVVQRIESGESGVLVFDSKGDVYEAEEVVLAVPITVLQKDMIAFEPPLSQDRRQAFREIGMDKGGKLFLKLEKRLWPRTLGFLNLDKSQVCQEWWEHNGWAHDEDSSQPLILAALVTD